MIQHIVGTRIETSVLLVHRGTTDLTAHERMSVSVSARMMGNARVDSGRTPGGAYIHLWETPILRVSTMITYVLQVRAGERDVGHTREDGHDERDRTPLRKGSHNRSRLLLRRASPQPRSGPSAPHTTASTRVDRQTNPLICESPLRQSG